VIQNRFILKQKQETFRVSFQDVKEFFFENFWKAGYLGNFMRDICGKAYPETLPRAEEAMLLIRVFNLILKDNMDQVR